MADERKRILKMVEDGMLSAEEALKLLESLERDRNVEPNSTDTSLSVDVDWENAEQSTHKKEAKRPRFSDFVETAIKKIKDVDFDFNFGTSYAVNHIFQQKDVDLKSIYVDIANGSVKCMPWDEQDVRIECDVQVFKARDEEHAREEFLKDARFTVEGERMYFSMQRKTIKVQTVLYIPRSHYEKINIRTFNGQVSGEKLEVKSLQAKTANGAIRFARIQGTDIELEAANGKVMLEHSQAKDLDIETLNGRIVTHGSYEKVDLKSFSGNIECTLTDSNSRSIFLNTKTGSIDVFVPKNIEVHGTLKSNLGRFGCYLENISTMNETKDVVQKEMKFTTNDGSEHSLQLEAEAKAGSVFVKHR
ncbi:DUF4097 domain-containing protein [Bacillus tianshenii]|nr:DUF4097 domain-containing protein [Bacillus tianshenii]